MGKQEVMIVSTTALYLEPSTATTWLPPLIWQGRSQEGMGRGKSRSVERK